MISRKIVKLEQVMPAPSDALSLTILLSIRVPTALESTSRERQQALTVDVLDTICGIRVYAAAPNRFRHSAQNNCHSHIARDSVSSGCHMRWASSRSDV